MAVFTATQQTSIRLYLGYPDSFRYKDTRLESMFMPGAISDEAITSVLASLTSIAAIETQILGRGLGASGVKAVDEIEFFEGKNSEELRNYGKMYVGRISITLGVPIYSNVFGNHGYLGDKYSAGGLGNSSGSRSIIPLG